jgi:uncharacterized protein YqfA (UPF0365 family)
VERGKRFLESVPQERTVMDNPVALIIVVVLFLFVAMFYVAILGPWLKTFTTRTPISLGHVLFMRIRKVNPHAIIDAQILARHNDVPVSIPVSEMERAYLMGLDVEKITLALLEAKRRKLPLTFQELIQHELEGRLAEKFDTSQ